MKNIIVATDLSKTAKNAAVYARDLAITLKADLHLIYVYSIPVTYGEVAVPASIDDNVEDLNEELRSLKNELGTGHPGLKISYVVRLGTFLTELDQLCNQLKPFAVVMGCQGTSAAERVIFGGHAVDALRHLDWPVIAVPKEASFSTIKRIGAACDLKHDTDPGTYAKLDELATTLNAELHILNSGPRREFSPDIVYESHKLENVLIKHEPIYVFVDDEDPDQGIMRLVKQKHIDLLVVLPKHRNMFESIVHRSHTKDLALHSTVPVMSVHA